MKKLPPRPAIENVGKRVLSVADAWMNRLYGWRHNPLYRSGAIVVWLLVIILVTGLYLLFFYRIAAPHASVQHITDEIFLGRFTRSLHRYASDAAVVAALIHALRVFAQGRSWGPRALAWVSGLVLLFVILVSGWTGYVMIWDGQALELAREGARLLDALPLFAEPIGRSFVGEQELPSAFFFLNLFLHVALPIGIFGVLWLHVSRVARPHVLPPRAVLYGVSGVLIVLSLLWPFGMEPAADLFRVTGRVGLDVFFNGWLPISQSLSSGVVWGGLGLVCLVCLGAPWWVSTRKRRVTTPPSVVDTSLCDGCEQCYHDCPYEAIAMVEMEGTRKGIVAQVDPRLCVSCSICSGSCAPMAVGPPGRSGRDQLRYVKKYILDRGLGAADVVIVACQQGAGGVALLNDFEAAPVFRLNCTGSMHSSVVEYLVRSGVGGVLIVACPAMDCTNREGPKWLEQRLYHDREAELQARVDRSRIRLLHASFGEHGEVRAALIAFRNELRDRTWTVDEGDREIVARIEREFVLEPGNE